MPYFPLGGFSPLQSDTLFGVAARLDTTPMTVALAWLLQRSPNILLIPGTSSVEHLRENVAGAGMQLPDDAIKELDDIRRLRPFNTKPLNTKRKGNTERRILCNFEMTTLLPIAG